MRVELLKIHLSVSSLSMFMLLQKERSCIQKSLQPSTRSRACPAFTTSRKWSALVIPVICASFWKLRCWVALTKLVRSEWVRADTLVALGITATVIALNASRLYLMALSPENFAYWHNGFGEQVFAYATTFAVLLISLWGAIRLGPKG